MSIKDKSKVDGKAIVKNRLEQINCGIRYKC